ncbi:hypothetical protein FRB99_001377 [Tulasnella sp. 403]|nr:hypothetical protein FRB99_001377 [Tulasnella sp. 403]
MNFPRSSQTALATLHRPNPATWVLELKNGPDNRLTDVMCQQVIPPALDVVEKEWREARRKALEADHPPKGAGGGALIIVGRLDQDKFFSNGFDFDQVLSTPGMGFVYNNFVPILIRLLTFPIPTIAALNGHAFAAGFMLTLACDYRLMTSGKAWACMNEVHFGAPFPRSFAAIMQEKVRSPAVIRSIALEGHRFSPKEALQAGIVDQLVDGGSKALFEKALVFAQTITPNASTGVWGLIKKEMYGTTIAKVAEDYRQVMPFEEDAIAKAKL